MLMLDSHNSGTVQHLQSLFQRCQVMAEQEAEHLRLRPNGHTLHMAKYKMTTH